MSLDPTTLGGLHTLAGLIAILAGIPVLGMTKGSRGHRLRGRLYLVAMLATNLSALAIYAHGSFNLAHWMTLLNLGLLGIAFAAARLRRPVRGWIHLHAGAMALSYFLLLFATVNEVFLRLGFFINLAAKFDLLIPGLIGFLLLTSVVTIAYLLRVTARRLSPRP